MKKVTLITGTSSGLGLETSILLAKNGYTVYATMRNPSKKEALLEKAKENNVTVHTLPLNVTNDESVKNCVDKIMQKEGQIDLLVNNAGAGFAKTVEEATEAEIKWVTEVNYLGVVRCTQAVIPIMREQRSGHIVNITSVGGLVGQPFNELYCGAKFAVEGFTESLASYVGHAFNINFSLIEPGGISTDFMKSAVEKTAVDGQLAQGEYLPLFEQYRANAQARAEKSAVPIYQTGAQVAEVVLDVIQQEDPPLRVRTSEWAENLCHLKTAEDPTGEKLLQKVRTDFLGDE